jgi:hypothetical protein
MTMRTTLALLVGTASLLTACGDPDPPTSRVPDATATAPTVRASAPATDDIPSRALTAPGSVAALEGVLVRYDQPAGEGPGFDLRFLDDGTVVYEFLGHDPLAFTTTSATYDVDELMTLIDGIEPIDLASGTADCMPEVDGSAPRLSLAEFEIDYCYTNPTEHPLVELTRSRRAELDVRLDELNEPGSGAVSGDFPAPTDFDGVLARYSMPGGECDRCDFATTFRDDGTVELRSSRGDHDSSFEVAALRDLLAAFVPSEFATTPADCGREVDGNAPILEVARAKIDLCLWDHVGDDRLYAYVVAEHERVEAERDAALAGPVLITRVTSTGGLCPDGICSSVLEFRADGTWATVDDDPVVGTYDPLPLVEAITADHASSPVVGPFTGTCPTAYDGVEVFYELFDPTTGAVVLATSTCTDELDPDHPLIRAVAAAVESTRAS